MFRKMRRFKQQITEEECIEVLKNERRGVLSVIGENGYPYGMPVNHWYDEESGKIYIHGAKAGHKIDAIKECNKVSFCTMDEGYTEGDDWALNVKSVIVFGTVRTFEHPDDPDLTRKVCVGLSAKFTDDPNYADDEIDKVGRNVLCLEITPDHMTGKLVNEA